jgi:hypothetical protein
VLEKVLYNVTIKIDLDVHDEWMDWMKKIHIPEVLETNLFESHKFSQILGTDEAKGLTYAIQYVCPTLDDFEKYQNQFAPDLQKQHTEKYKDKFVAFRTMMRIVDES